MSTTSSKVSKVIPPHRRGKTTYSGMAAPKVFAIPELLEATLLHADSRTILVLQRVNRTFRDVVAGSKVLQIRVGFILPSPTCGVVSRAISNPCAIELLRGLTLKVGSHMLALRGSRVIFGSGPEVLKFSFDGRDAVSARESSDYNCGLARDGVESWRRVLLTGGGTCLMLIDCSAIVGDGRSCFWGVQLGGARTMLHLYEALLARLRQEEERCRAQTGVQSVDWQC
ncbi:hypothetical protein LTR56_009461 [Elasticomyces elasticus]|nr:hypothetical protein LTR56_009461 [Elasticomyces elasticus]KAK3645893.1 hypothetical protein LTR22_014559 [Elasticomyces elasticus]KAK4931020.1 hypothetical protein LTR49_002435 [Elasticomyces elasticus]KAK5765487.1 hypothetical protein LTS12_004238 [Elasticomyces elasticus]